MADFKNETVGFGIHPGNEKEKVDWFWILIAGLSKDCWFKNLLDGLGHWTVRNWGKRSSLSINFRRQMYSPNMLPARAFMLHFAASVFTVLFVENTGLERKPSYLDHLK